MDELYECGVIEEEAIISNVDIVTGNPEVFNDDLTLTDVIILSDLDSESNTTARPEDQSLAPEEEHSSVMASYLNNTAEEGTTATEQADVLETVSANESLPTKQPTTKLQEEIKSTSNPDDDINTTETITSTIRPETTTTQKLNVRIVEKGEDVKETKENAKKIKLLNFKKNTAKSVGKKKAEDKLINKEVILVIQNNPTNITSSVPKKGPKPMLKDKVTTRASQELTPSSVKQNETSTEEPKSINRKNNEPPRELIEDNATSKPAITKEAATVVKSTSEKVLVLDRKALWGMLREGSKTTEENKKGG